MPHAADGTRTPPPPERWAAYLADVLARCRPECAALAERFVRTCQERGGHPDGLLRRWALRFRDARRDVIPPNWPDWLTAGDWASLVLYAEHETETRGVTP